MMANELPPKPYSASALLGNSVHELALAIPVKQSEWVLHKVGLLEGQLAKYALEPDSALGIEREQIMQELNTGLALYHEALPFGEAERRWLSTICLAIEEDNRYHFYYDRTKPAIETVRSAEATVVSGGVFMAVKGENLYQRWLSWHRQEGEFERTGSVGIAYRGLLRAAALLKPGFV